MLLKWRRPLATRRRGAPRIASCASGSVRDVVLARVPLADHRRSARPAKRCGASCTATTLRSCGRPSDARSPGLLLLAGWHPIAGCGSKAILVSNAQPGSLGFAALDSGPWILMSSRQHSRRTGDSSFVAMRTSIERCSSTTRGSICGSRLALSGDLPAIMYGQCTAFLDNTLVVVAGGTNDEARPWGFSWDEQLRMWQSLPPVPTAVASWLWRHWIPPLRLWAAHDGIMLGICAIIQHASDLRHDNAEAPH